MVSMFILSPSKCITALAALSYEAGLNDAPSTRKSEPLASLHKKVKSIFVPKASKTIRAPPFPIIEKGYPTTFERY